MAGGDIDRYALIESFSKIKEDITILNKELLELKTQHKKVLSENIELKNQLGAIDPSIIRQIISETIRNVKSRPRPSKRKKLLIKNRILELAARKDLSLSDVNEIIVQQEELCSKATFYRYVDKLKKLGKLETIKINEVEVLVSA